MEDGETDTGDPVSAKLIVCEICERRRRSQEMGMVGVVRIRGRDSFDFDPCAPSMLGSFLDPDSEVPLRSALYSFSFCARTLSSGSVEIAFSDLGFKISVIASSSSLESQSSTVHTLASSLSATGTGAGVDDDTGSAGLCVPLSFSDSSEDAERPRPTSFALEASSCSFSFSSTVSSVGSRLTDASGKARSGEIAESSSSGIDSSVCERSCFGLPLLTGKLWDVGTAVRGDLSSSSGAVEGEGVGSGTGVMLTSSGGNLILSFV